MVHGEIDMLFVERKSEGCGEESVLVWVWIRCHDVL